jgi:hypothetical protein
MQIIKLTQALDRTPHRRSKTVSHAVLAACALISTSGTVMAQTAVAPKPVTATDVAAAPVDTLNLRKEKTAPVLVAAKAHPYTLPGGGSCAALNRNVGQLNEALGPDIEEVTNPSEQQKRAAAIAGTARSVVNSLIPFGGIVREITGATAEEKRRAVFLYAGSVRRAFLKGYARAKGCRIQRTVIRTAPKK